MSGRAAVFVDRDGVINELVADATSGHPESPLRVDDVRLITGAAGALRSLKAAGFVLVGASNQPAAAKGTITMEQLLAVQTRVLEQLAGEGASLDAFELCLHHPDGTVPELSGRCECRKPEPGMLLAAADRLGIDRARSWMVGDTDADVGAGQAAGVCTILIEYPGSAHKRSDDSLSDRFAADLAAAAQTILSSG